MYMYIYLYFIRNYFHGWPDRIQLWGIYLAVDAPIAIAMAIGLKGMCIYYIHNVHWTIASTNIEIQLP